MVNRFRKPIDKSLITGRPRLGADKKKIQRNLRVSNEQWSIWQRAAFIKGMGVLDFVIASSNEAAQTLVDK